MGFKHGRRSHFQYFPLGLVYLRRSQRKAQQIPRSRRRRLPEVQGVQRVQGTEGVQGHEGIRFRV